MISLLNASHHKLAPRHLLYATLFFLTMYWDYKLVGGFIVATIAFIVGYGAAVSLKEKVNFFLLIDLLIIYEFFSSYG